MGGTNVSTSDALAAAAGQIIRQKIARLRAEIAEKEEEVRLYELLLGAAPVVAVPVPVAAPAATAEVPGKSKRKKRTQPVIDAMQRLARPATVGEITENLLAADPSESGNDSDWSARVSQTLYHLEQAGKVLKTGSFGSYTYALAAG